MSRSKFMVSCVRAGILAGLLAVIPQLIESLKPYQAWFYGLSLFFFVLWAAFAVKADVVRQDHEKRLNSEESNDDLSST